MKAFIFGSGPQGRVILDILRAAGLYETIEFLDDNAALWNTEVNGCRIAGGFDAAAEHDPASAGVILAVGHSPRRLQLAVKARAASVRLLNAVHPSAVVMASALLGEGNMIAPLAVINSNASIGDNAIVNTGAVIEHDSVVEDGASVSPGVQFGGRGRIGRCAFLGTGSIVLPRIRIGEFSVVAAGSVVTKDVPPRVLVRGTPARIVEELDDNFDWKRVL